MNIIDLSDAETLPSKLITRLQSFDDLFQNEQDLYLNEFKNQPDLHKLIKDINEYCSQHLLIGYHYTRAFPESIISKGLLNRSGEEIRSEFLKQHSQIFSSEEISQITNAWEKYFKWQRASRDFRIFYNFTLASLGTPIARPLLENYGGEQVYMPIAHLPTIKDKLLNIGEPLVVKCIIHPKNIEKDIGYRFGQIIASNYQKLHNPDTFLIDMDAYQTIPIPPKNIIEVVIVKDSI